jgi:1,4-alpha-glucan branching enzyme
VPNSDALLYRGSGVGNAGGVHAVSESHHGRPYRLDITAPPLAVVVFYAAGSATQRS